MRLAAARTGRRGLAALVLILVLVVTILPLALGSQAQRAYHDLLAATLDALPKGSVIVEHYDRGWFSSRASAELALQPPGGGPPNADSPRIRLDSRIEQGPLCWLRRDGFPVMARVRTRLEWVDQAARLPPLLITTNLSADGGALARLLIPAVDQTGGHDGYRLRSPGLVGLVRYAPGAKTLGVEIGIPALELITPSGPSARLTDATLKSDLQGWTGGLYTGTSRLQIGAASLGLPDAGAVGSGPGLDRLTIELTQTPRDRNLDLRLQAQAATLHLGGRDYRAAQIDVTAESLEGEPLAELITGLRALSSDTRSQPLRGLIGATLVTRTLPRLLASGPQFALDPVRVDTAEGPARLRLHIGAPQAGGGAPGHRPNGLDWLAAITGAGELDLPETLALDWLRRAERGTPAAARQRLDRWQDQGWVLSRDGRVTSTFRLADGKLSINDKTLPLLDSTRPRNW